MQLEVIKADLPFCRRAALLTLLYNAHIAATFREPRVDGGQKRRCE